MLDRTAEGGCLYGVQILLEQTLRVPEADWGAKGSAVTAEGGRPRDSRQDAGATG